MTTIVISTNKRADGVLALVHLDNGGFTYIGIFCGMSYVLGLAITGLPWAVGQVRRRRRDPNRLEIDC